MKPFRFLTKSALLSLAVGAQVLLHLAPEPVWAQGAPGKIAYVADNELWLMESDGSGKTSLGIDAGEFVAYDVALSPDSGWLVFTGVSFGVLYPPGSNGLWLMKAEPYGPANEPQYLGPNGATFSRASWHPDGRHVAYIGLDGFSTNQIYLVEALDENGDVSGASFEALSSGSAGNSFTDCAFHPDGQHLMASQLGHDLVMFQVFDAAGARTGSLVANPLPPITLFSEGYATWPSFSPDGKKVVFSHYKASTFNIAVLTIRDGAGNPLVENVVTNPRVLYTAGSSEYLASPSWSPDGSKIVFHDSTGYYRLFTLNANAPENGSTNQRVEVAGVNGVDTKFPSFAHPGAPAPVPAPVPTNLISWWPGENTAWDVAGSRQGSMKNSPNEDPYDVGKVGRAFWFDGIDDHIEGSSGSGSLVQDLTIEAWVQPLNDTGEAMIVSKKSNDSDTVSYSLLLRDGRPVFRSVTNGVASELAATGNPLPTFDWTHLAFTEDDEVGRKIYVNGTLIASIATVPSRSTTGGPVTIGAFIDDTHPTATPGSPFDGLVDELSLYNRALSGTEIGLIHAAGKAGKARHDPARDFSATKNFFASTSPENLNNTRWRYGWVDGVMPIPGTDPQEYISSPPVPSYLTDGNPDNGALFPPSAVLEDSTYLYGNEFGAHLRFNPSKTDRVTITEGDPMDPTRIIELAPRQFAFHPAIGGDLDYSVLQWVVPENGKYALSATFTGAEDSPTSTVVHLYHGDNALFIPDTMADPPETNMIDSFLGDGVSTTEELNLSANQTVTWIVGGGAAPGHDYTGVVASAVKLDDFQPFARPEFNGDGIFGYKPPLMNGKTVRFEGRNTDREDHASMSGKIQYSATPGDPGSWFDLPGGTMTSSGPTSQTFFLTINSLPVGTFAFRIATTATGPFGEDNEVIEATTFSAPSDTFTVYPAGPHYEVEIDVSSASDPTGVTTHRGDTLTYTAMFRNSGGATVPATDQVKVLVRVPDGTSATTGSTAGYEIVHSGSDTFAMWTLTKPFRPVDPEPEFTIPVASSDLILSDLHNLEVGDLVQVYTDGTLPGGLQTNTDYEVISTTTNQFQLALPRTTTPIDITSGGTGTHKFERLWQTRTLKLAVADPPVIDETSVDDVDLGDNLVTFARITNDFSGLGGIADSDEEETTVVNPLSLTAAAPVVDVSPLKQGGTLSVDFTVKNKATSPTTGTFLRVLAPPGLTIRGGVFVGGTNTPAPELTETGTALFSVGDLADASSFLAKLKNPTDIVSSYLSTQLRANTKHELSKWQVGTNPPGSLRLLIVEDLNLVLRGESIWAAGGFFLVPTRPETDDLRASDPTGDSLLLLNRMLLEDAYPVELLRNTFHVGGQQILIFEIGPLAPGAERVCQARFRVQYDLNLANLPYFDFNPEENGVDNRRAIEFFHATASINRPSLATHESVPYTTFKKVKKPKKKGKKQKFKLVPVPGVRVVPVNYVRNGLEAELENPFGLEVLEGPRDPASPHPRINLPRLGVSISQEAAGFVPGTEKAVVTQDELPIVGADPARQTNQIRYTVTYRNEGNVDAEFVRALVPCPEGTSYVLDSLRHVVLPGDPTPPSVPKILVLNSTQQQFLIFNLALLNANTNPPPPPGMPRNPSPGSEKSFSFLVELKDGITIDTELTQPGASVTSRDLVEAGTVFHQMKAKVSLPGRMAYGKPDIKTFTDVNGNILEIHHQMKYENIGETEVSDVEIRYTIPVGFLLVDADILDIEGDRILKSLQVVKPTLPDREVVFPIGTVSRSNFDINGNWVPGAGWARVRLEKDPNNPPVQPPVGEDGYRLDGTFAPPTDSTTPQNSDPESLVAESASVYTAATSIAEGNVFIGVRGPHYVYHSTVGAPSEITYQVTWGSARHRTPGAGGVIFPIPPGTTYVTHSGAEGLHGQGAGHGGTVNAANQVPGYPYAHVAWVHNISGGSKAEFATVTVRVDPGFAGPVVCDGAYISGDQAGIRHAIAGRTTITDIADIRLLAAGMFGSFSEADEAFLKLGPNKVHAKMELIDAGSTWFGLGGADALVLADTIVINIGDGKIVAAGGGNIVAGGGGNIVAVGGGNIVAGGGGNIVAGGGGNIVAGGGGNIQIRMPEGNMMSATDIFANIRSIVAGGGGNIVAGGGLNLVRYVVSNDGAGLTLDDLIAKGLVGLDGASLIGLDGSTEIGLLDISNFNTGEMMILDPENIEPPQLMLAGREAMMAMGEGKMALVYSPEGPDGGVVIDADAVNLQNAEALIRGSGSPFAENTASTLIGEDGASLAAKAATLIGQDGANLTPRAAGIITPIGNSFMGGSGLR